MKTGIYWFITMINPSLQEKTEIIESVKRLGEGDFNREGNLSTMWLFSFFNQPDSPSCLSDSLKRRNRGSRVTSATIFSHQSWGVSVGIQVGQPDSHSSSQSVWLQHTTSCIYYSLHDAVTGWVFWWLSDTDVFERLLMIFLIFTLKPEKRVPPWDTATLKHQRKSSSQC